MDFTILLHFLISIALGGLIGIERQRKMSTGDFAGVRSFMLISFFGAITAFLYQNLGEHVVIFLVGFIAVLSLIVSTYIVSSLKGYFGITTEVSALITFLLGFTVMFPSFRDYSLIFAVIITVILTFKDRMHSFIENTKTVEWNDTIKFALITFVVLPLLPKEITIPIFTDPNLQELNVFYPQEIWLLVVFVGAISFVGYFLVKMLGETRGTNVIGAVGGIVSSTAVTQSMASHSKTLIKKKFVPHQPFVRAVVLATIVSFSRAGLIGLSINFDLSEIIVPIASLILLGIIILIFFLYDRDKALKSVVKLDSPLKIRPALILGGLYALLTFLSKLSFALDIGPTGILIAAAVTGFFDIDPIILTLSSLSAAGTISTTDAVIGILLAVGSNQITKSVIAITSGSRQFGTKVARILLLFVVIILAWVLYFKFQ